jgi:8-oxo-dGTP diphosphatase
MLEKSPALTVDAVILKENSIVLIKRKKDPFKGMWAIPGGFVEWGETVEQAAIREAKEETCLDVKIEKLIGVYSDPIRDPRGHTVSVCFLCREVGGDLMAATDAGDARYFKLSELPELAFDHGEILGDIAEFLKGIP